MDYRPLNARLIPQIVPIELGGAELSAAIAGEELRRRAIHDDDHCYGYFPSFAGLATIDTSLPLSAAFAELMPTITVQNKQFSFSFLRLSLIRQPSQAPYHVDNNSMEALRDHHGLEDDVKIWRLLINLNPRHSRTVNYLDLDPASVPLVTAKGYTHFAAENLPQKLVRTLKLPPLRQGIAKAALLCASHVLHSGQDDKHGHFVAGYGCETTQH